MKKGHERAMWKKQELHTTRTYDDHEMIHMLLVPLGYPPFGLAEGAVFYVLGSWEEGRDLHMIAKELLTGSGFPRSTRYSRRRRWTTVGMSNVVPGWASFSIWLIDRHGIDKFMKLYKATNEVEDAASFSVAFQDGLRQGFRRDGSRVASVGAPLPAERYEQRIRLLSPLRRAARSAREGRHLRMTCRACGFVHYRNPAPAAGVVIVENGAVLLVKRRFDPFKGLWVDSVGIRRSTTRTCATTAAREALRGDGARGRDRCALQRSKRASTIRAGTRSSCSTAPRRTGGALEGRGRRGGSPVLSARAICRRSRSRRTGRCSGSSRSDLTPLTRRT